MRKLAVYYNDTEAGILTEQYPGAGYTFQYNEEYLNSTMLPEGANRRGICRSQRIDENDFFGLLKAMADKDFIGAVNVRRMDND